ncbi:MAG: carboxypeptidase regulatory-like domain-containing protein [Planctomycetes bacterium]|nr:carboxypeptidase regulatory-like domain-containing protein [Planctomycetota bacterium]
MNPRARLLYVALAVVLCTGGAVAWVLSDLGAFTAPHAGDVAEAHQSRRGDGPLDVFDTAPNGAQGTEHTPSDSPQDPTALPLTGVPERRAGQPHTPRSSDSPRSSDAPSGTPPSREGTWPSPAGQSPEPTTQPPAKPAEVIPRSARDPTPREKAARERYNGSAGLPTKVSAPKAVQESSEELPLDLAKLAEPEIWAEYWAREGYSPPAMVKTPVRGKLMSQLTNTQVPGAKVRIYTFFPATSRLNGPLLPVMTEAATDEKGFFEADLPTPKSWPSDYPRYALSCDWQDKRIIDCAPYDNLRAGEANEIGIFWAPEEPYELEVSVSNPEPGLIVAPTGRIDPRRWESRRAKQVFASFSVQPMAAAGTKVIGSWDFLADPPFVTLLRAGSPVLTKRCEKLPEQEPQAPVVEPSENGKDDNEVPLAEVSEIGTPFKPMQFPNDGYLSFSGTVVDPDGKAVEGAVLKLLVNAEPRVSYTDSTGWFEFGALPDKPLQLTVSHDLYVDVEQVVQPGVTDKQIQFDYRRPRMTLTVVRDSDGTPVTEVWFRFSAWPNTTPIIDEHPGTQTRRMESATGVYLFENDKPLLSLWVTAPGLQPVEADTEDQLASLEIRMTDGLVLERRPRDYDAVQNEGLWHVDENEGPGLWSLDDDHWVEYSFNFGENANDFDLALGVTNHTYSTLPLDNEYEFIVDVFVDGKKVGTLNIGSDPGVQQIGQLPLGSLSGQHTVRLMWMNDRYIPGQLDANIRYESLRIIEVP